MGGQMNNDQFYRIQQRVDKFFKRLPWRRRNQVFLIDVIDACSLRCPTCPTGVQLPRDGARMSLDMFKKILDKGQKECNIMKVQLFRFGDPLLHPKIHEFIEECNRRGLKTGVSSALQATNCDWQKLAASKVTEFRASFSGWKNMHIYQKPAKIERFLEKFEMVSHLPWAKETTLTMLFHEYMDNKDEIGPARELAESHGFKFIPIPAQMMVYDNIVNGYSPRDHATLDLLFQTPEEDITRLKHAPTGEEFCGMQEREVTLDAHGNMRLCQFMYTTDYIIGNYLERPLKEMRKEIINHPWCVKCKTKGLVGYSMCYADPVTSKNPVKEVGGAKYGIKMNLDSGFGRSNFYAEDVIKPDEK
jgi:radical SAM protein with 4Fe4S-binding SPASM domain